MSYHTEYAKSSCMNFPYDFVDYVPCDCAVFDAKGAMIAASTSFKKVYACNNRNIDFIINKTLQSCSSDTSNYIISLNTIDYNISIKYIDNYIILLLQNITQNIEAVFEKANRDFLTNLWNRRAFAEKVESILATDTWNEYQMIGLDIDYFKNINDLFGHPAGDEVIKKIAQCCAKTIRETDLAGRWGGEEFFLFIKTSVKDAFEIAERLREMVDDLYFIFDGKQASCSISLGISGEHKDTRPTIDELIKMADQALYKAKNTGRNKTVIYTK